MPDKVTSYTWNGTSWSENTENESDSEKSEERQEENTGSIDNGGGNSEDTSNISATNPDPESSTGSTEKKYNEIEVNTLKGNLNFIANDTTLKLQAGQTVRLIGIGKYLSGNYYVESISRRLDSNGYSHTAVLVRTDFGSTLKKKKDGKEIPSETKKVPSPQQPAKSREISTKTYTVKAGDTLWGISKEMYGDSSSWEKIYNANSDKCHKESNGVVTIAVGETLNIP